MRTIFALEPMENLRDCFRAPLPDMVFFPQDGVVRGWPSFHASEADPDGGYAARSYTVAFHMDQPRDCALAIKIYVSTPRLPYLEIVVNGFSGHWYPDPIPARDAVIRPAHALHAAIYSVDETRLAIPARAFRAGENRLTLTARDDEPAERITNREAVLRLDRMADACGFHYAHLRLEEAPDNRVEPRLSLRPSVVYRHAEGGLVEECEMVCVPEPGREETAGALHLSWQGGNLLVPFTARGRLFGEYRQAFLLPDGEGLVTATAEGPLQETAQFTRRRKWRVYTTPHAHTDIGYTHRQSEVAERMSRNLDTALNLLEGEGAEGFSYILDSAWSVEDFAQTRGKQAVDRLLRQVELGKIGIPANYVDLLTQFASLEELIQNGAFSERLLSPAGLVADRADIVDVASASFSLPSLLHGMGVRYLLHANNQDRGPFRLNGGLHRKSPFWWQGPDGKRVLTWLARMYCEFKKVCGSPGSFPAARRGLSMWLKEYERADYLPGAVILYGQEADNTDLDVRMAAFSRAWSEQIAYPKLIPSNGSSFFEDVLSCSDSFPVYAGDEGAYWEDGAAASPLSSFAARHAQALLKSAQTLDSLAAIADRSGAWPADQYQEAWRWLLLYAEHTWGSFLSGIDPESQLQQAQWETKANMARQALQCAGSLMTRAASRLSLRWNNQGRELVVYNPHSFPLSGLVQTEFRPDETVLAPEGHELDWQETGMTGSLTGALVQVEEVPALSYRRFVLTPKQPGHRGGGLQQRDAAQVETLENAFLRVTVDTVQACVTGMLARQSGRELCGRGLGALLHTRGRRDSTLLGNHAQYRQQDPEEIRGFAVQSARVETSAIGQAVILGGQADIGPVQARFFLPAGEDRLDLSYQVGPLQVGSPEALYVDFDFKLPEDTRILSDSQTAWVDWSRDTLPGACREWLPLQTSVLLKSGDGVVQIASPEAFLFTAGQPVKGLWSSEIVPRGGRVLSYVFNNHWQTNYPLGEKGELRFSYSLTASADASLDRAYRFGWAARQGLFVQRMSYQEFRGPVPAPFDAPGGGTMMAVESGHIRLNTLFGSSHEPGAFVARLMECEGREGSVALRHPDLIAWQDIDHLQRPLGGRQTCQGSALNLTLTPWQVRSVLLYFVTTPNEVNSGS